MPKEKIPNIIDITKVSRLIQSITDEVIFDFEGEQYRLNISDQTDFLYRVMEAKAEALQII